MYFQSTVDLRIGPGMRLVAEANDGPAIVLDSHTPPFGTNTGPAPMELFLMGLGGCTGMDVISILAKKRQKVTGFQVKVEAERAPTHPKVYTKIHIEYIVYGESLEPKGGGAGYLNFPETRLMVPARGCLRPGGGNSPKGLTREFRL